MNAHDTPSGTRMMWNPSVNAICARAQGTGSTANSVMVGWGCTSGHAFAEVLTHSQGVGDDGEGRGHGADRREEARVDDVEVVELVGLAVDVSTDVDAS